MQDAKSHFHPDLAAKALRNSLAHHCDGASGLVVPKLLSIHLYSCNLVEEYIRPFYNALQQFTADIDRNAEKSPDAKSIGDFLMFSQSLGYQSRNHLDPICQLSGSPKVAEVCRAVAGALEEFHRDVKRIAVNATRELVEKHFPALSHHDPATALNALQWMSLEDRKRQEGVARVYLDQMQTEARQAYDAVVENREAIRREGALVREMLRTAESICNSLGGMKSAEVVDAFREESVKRVGG